MIEWRSSWASIAKALPFEERQCGACFDSYTPVPDICRTPFCGILIVMRNVLTIVGGSNVHTLLREVCIGDAIGVAVVVLPCL